MFAERVQTRYADKRFSRPEFVIPNVRKKGEDENNSSQFHQHYTYEQLLWQHFYADLSGIQYSV